MARIHERLTKTKGKTYWFIIDVGRDDTGKRIRIKRCGFTKKSDAKKAMAEIESQYYAGKVFTKPKDITFAYYVQEIWFKEYQHYTKISTQKGIQYLLKALISFWGQDVKLKHITALNIQAYIQNMLDMGKKRKTITKNLTYIKMIFKHALKNNIITNNPCENIDLPKMTLVEKTKLLQQKPKPLYLEKEDLLTFLNEAKNDAYAYPYYYMVYFLVYTGARLGEVCAMEWDNFNIKNKTIKITQNIYGCSQKNYYVQTPKTKNSIREISISQSFIDVMKEWRLIQNKQKIKNANNWDRTYNFIFTSRYYPGKPILTCNLYGFIKKIAKKIGLSWISPYPHIIISSSG